MNYFLNPSLEHIALVKLSVILWNSDDIKKLIAEFNIIGSNEEIMEKWQEIEANVVKKIKKLPILESIFTEKISWFIKPIGLQILRSLEYHYGGNGFGVGMPKKFIWTPQGTIDKKKTADILIKDERIDITTRYQLACVYCLEDHVRDLWEKLPEDSQNIFYNEEDPQHIRQNQLVLLWTFDIKGDRAKIEKLIEKRLVPGYSPSRYGFQISATHGHRIATEYFFKKLTFTEITNCLVTVAGFVTRALRHMDISNKYLGYSREYYVEILVYLLVQMNDDEQTELLKLSSFQVLRCFLDWPLQIFFIETASRAWNFLTGEFYGRLLILITNKVLDGHKEFDYEKLFCIYWQKGSNKHKKEVLRDKRVNGHIMTNLFKIKDEDNIKLFFQGATIEEKNEVMSSDGARNIRQVLTDREDWNLLSLLDDIFE